ncbi:MAG: [FeFe] hydrogenase H-cluster radical SAM maturase HydE [Syntrophomonadaceae bacterium]|nr:[FeFe] hydrogenase H-cluster radical SAM maturase HydE [Syntrophomonadaceae bacterium]MDD4550055.1 [FeFe] hydrogenase H-cluster radical SAM maturase HydE [Syntrophomonadaceae bacterium]
MNLSSKADIFNILASSETAVLDKLIQQSNDCRQAVMGNKVFLRGLIEYSNDCCRNCLYCGIRKNNQSVNRYHLPKEEIIALAMHAHQQGYQSICLQAGETDSDQSIECLADVVKEIKDLSSQNGMQSLGITLSVGELSYQQYKKLWEAGAHRYLLRIESSDRELFQRIHPPTQSFEKRLECLDALRDVGFQVGTGVMIGLPGQSAEHLAMDLDFFQQKDIDMLGMGPYIPHPAAPLSRLKPWPKKDTFTTTLKMIALARLLMPDINIVASTALQTINPQGLQWGLKAGANIVMPVLTPEDNRQDYNLYLHKKYKSIGELNNEIQSSGYQITCWQWGDSRHYYSRRNTPYPVNT